MCVMSANVTVYILTQSDTSIQFVPPLGSNRTIVVYIVEELPVATFVFRPEVRDVDNPSAVFRYQLNSSVEGYVQIDPDTGIYLSLTFSSRKATKMERNSLTVHSVEVGRSSLVP